MSSTFVPTYSHITENQDPELYTTSKEFEINKKILKEDFNLDNNKENKKIIFLF